MTDMEQRRSELLNQTRKIYSDKNTPPAIHPRYTGAYGSIYKNKTSSNDKKTTLGIRFVIAILLFGLFVAVHVENRKAAERVVAEIQKEATGFVDLNFSH